MQTPATPLILTLDIGSSSVRALLIGADGRLVPGLATRRARSFHHDEAGAATDDPRDLLRSVAACIDEVLALAGPHATAIAAVAVDSYAASMVGVDAAGQPLTPIYTYADARPTAAAAALRRELDEDAVRERTGCPLRSAYAPARLRWLAAHEPAYGQVACWLGVGALLEQELFGSPRISSSAASWDGLLDRRTLAYDQPLLDHLRIDTAALPPLADAAEPRSGLRMAYAKRWPLLADLPWFPAIGDGAAANLGSGCTGPEQLAVTVGTTGALRVALPAAALVPGGLWCYRATKDIALLGGATSEGGNLFAWLRQTLRLPADAALDAALAALPPDGHGLTVLPFLTGERSPGYAGNVRATFSGLGADTTPVEIVQAAMESVAYRFGLIATLLATAAPAAQTIIASGGALLASPAWCQIVADVLGRPLSTSAEPEATARGTALLALDALGITRLHSLPAALGPAFLPHAQRHAVYQQAMQRQQQLYDALISPS